MAKEVPSRPEEAFQSVEDRDLVENSSKRLFNRGAVHSAEGRGSDVGFWYATYAVVGGGL